MLEWNMWWWVLCAQCQILYECYVVYRVCESFRREDAMDTLKALFRPQPSEAQRNNALCGGRRKKMIERFLANPQKKWKRLHKSCSTHLNCNFEAVLFCSASYRDSLLQLDEIPLLLPFFSPSTHCRRYQIPSSSIIHEKRTTHRGSESLIMLGLV